MWYEEESKNSMWVVLLKRNHDVSLRLFQDSVQAHLCANFYNIYTQVHAEVLLIPITEKVLLTRDKGTVAFKLLGESELDAEVEYAG